MSNIWFPSKVTLQRLQKVQRRCVKRICTKWNLSDSDYVLSLINQGLMPIGYKLVLTDLLLNKILVRQNILNPLDFWEIKSHDFNTRSSGKVLIYARETKQKRCKNFFVRVAKYNNALSFTYNLSWYTPLMNPKILLREMTKFFEAEAMSKLRYDCYPSGWDPLENFNQN